MAQKVYIPWGLERGLPKRGILGITPKMAQNGHFGQGIGLKYMGFGDLGTPKMDTPGNGYFGGYPIL